METSAKSLPAGKRASVSEARLAYFEGDFERCLELCQEIRVRTLPTASEISLLSARAYLRTGRPAEAEAVLRESIDTHSSLDASLTAQMLLGTARIRGGDPDGGLTLLAEATGRSGDAHFAVRSEIAFCTALGHWAKRDIDAAEMWLARVDRRADIIHARALELGAWCQMTRGNYRRSAEFFILTLLRLDSCRAHDRAIAATAVSTLSILAAEMFDREMARVAEHRARTMEWTSGLAVQQYLTLLHQAMYDDLAGETIAAYERSMQAREVAPTTAFEAYAWSVSSGIARNAGEANAAVVFAQRARSVLATVDLRELAGEERFAILTVAEACAHFDADGANRLLATYWGLAPADKMIALSGDPRLAAEELLVSAIVAEARGDRSEALSCYRSAFSEFDRLSYTRRAIVAAFALHRLECDANAGAYLRAKLNGTSNHITRWLADSAVAQAADQTQRTVAALPRAQREVLALVCQGKSNKEIADLRGVGEQTIKNMLTKHVFPSFGVASRAALISTCLQRA